MISKKITTKIIFSFLLTVISLDSYAQKLQENDLLSEKNTLKFDHFNVEQGLSNNYVTGFAQDSLGYIWVSTVDGLNRYNGNEFYNFKSGNDSINSLNYNFIQELKFNRKGELLIVTGAGLNIYNLKNETFSLISVDNGLVANSLSCLELGKENELILGIYGIGVQFFNPLKPNQSTTLKFDSKSKQSLSSNNISDIVLQGKKTVWVSTYDNGLNKINYETKEVQRVALSEIHNSGLSQINCLFLDKKNNLWVGTKSGIVVMDNQNHITHISKSNLEGKGLSGNEIISFEEDDMGNLWVGTQKSGFNIVNLDLYKQNKRAIKWYLPNYHGNNFTGETVSAIMKDKDGNMWVGTNYGLNYVNPKNQAIQVLNKENVSEPYSISNIHVNTMEERDNGDIWIGTEGGGLNLYNPSNRTYKYYVHDENNPASLSNDNVRSVLEDSKKRVWVGTYRGGLNLLDTERGTFKKYLQGSTENGNKVNIVYEDKNNTIWVGTNRGGLFKYDETNDTFDYIPTIGKLDIRDISEDDNGSFLMATYGNGVVQYDPGSKSYIYFGINNTNGMTSNIVYAILHLSDGIFLIGTGYGGLLKLNVKTRTVKSYEEKDGLSNNTVNSLIFQNSDEVWMGTFRGLSYFDISTETIKNLNYFENIASSDFNVGSALKTKKGLLYFGSNNGLFIINPDEIFNQNTDTPLIFESLKLFNNKVPVSRGNTKTELKKALPYLDHISLDHDQTLISIDFDVLKFPSSRNVKYSYLLKGYQDHWLNLNDSHTIYLNKLPQGTYNLVVKGVINPEKSVTNNLLITINPPFWETLPAYFIYLLVAVGLVWLGMKYYSERLKLKNSLLFEKKQRQLENELNLERVRFFTSFSHELKTPLSLIISPVEQLIEKVNKKKQKEQLEMVLKNSKYLLKNIQKLLEFRKSEIGLNKLTIDRVNILEYIDQILVSYKSIAKSRGINLTFDKPKNEIYLWCDVEKIEVIIHNFLSNAFKYSERNGKIELSVKVIDNRFLISVTDTGKGISKQDLPHVFEWYYQSNSVNRKKGSGIGLALSKIFAELHMGTIYVESEFNEGTKIVLDIPTDAFQERTNNADVTYTPTIENEEKNELITTTQIWEHEERYLESDMMKSKIKKDKSRELILAVDDNRDILKFLSSLLEEDYDLIFAENGETGIEKAIKYVPDLVISDVMMPEKSGVDLCGTLKTEQTTSHIPIILLTAKADIQGVNKGYEEGADDYITKPFNALILKTRIRNLIQNRLKLKDYFSGVDNETSGLSEENKKIIDVEKAFLERFEKLIEELIDKQDFSTETICAEIGMSRSSLFRKIKILTGKNINEFVRKVRLKKALHLIKYENYPVSQASLAVGFNSVKHFRRLFKEEYGTVPSKAN